MIQINYKLLKVVALMKLVQSGTSPLELKRRFLADVRAEEEAQAARDDGEELARVLARMRASFGLRRLRSRRAEEVATHNTMEDCWTVLRGKVYNLTPYVNFHPGGDKILKAVLGRDCTKLFDKYHKWVNGEYMLEKCKVGVLDTHVPGSDSENSEEEEEEEDFSFR